MCPLSMSLAWLHLSLFYSLLPYTPFLLLPNLFPLIPFPLSHLLTLTLSSLFPCSSVHAKVLLLHYLNFICMVCPENPKLFQLTRLHSYKPLCKATLTCTFLWLYLFFPLWLLFCFSNCVILLMTIWKLLFTLLCRGILSQLSLLTLILPKRNTSGFHLPIYPIFLAWAFRQLNI